MASDTLSWRAVFINQLMKKSFSELQAQLIYLIEMEARKFFDFSGIIPDWLALQSIDLDNTGIRYFWVSSSVQATCPSCKTLSTNPCHDYYTKYIQDIPFNSKAVYYVIRLNKFYCGNLECECVRFFERFPGLTEERLRKTTRFVEFCIKRSIACGCNRAENELRGEGAVISNDTILYTCSHNTTPL